MKLKFKNIEEHFIFGNLNLPYKLIPSNELPLCAMSLASCAFAYNSR